MTLDKNRLPSVESAANKKFSGRDLLLPFLLVASLFFIWGFCHAMLDVLNKHFQNILHVDKGQSGLVQTAFFSAYLLLGLPSALLIRRIGYQKGILMGLLVLALGAFLFIPAGLWFKTYISFLFALFVLASGLACIETSANPYVTILGPKDGAATRLSVAQAFNSMAYIIAPAVGGYLIFGKHEQSSTIKEGVDKAAADANFNNLLIPYVVLGCVVLLVFLIFSFIKLPDIDAQDEEGPTTADPADHKAPLIRQPHFVWGIITQFLYIAAQIGVNAFAVNLIVSNAVIRDDAGKESIDSLFAWYQSVTGAATADATAAYVLTIAMVLYAVGRFTGGLVAKLIKPNLMLSLYGVANIVITLLVMANIHHVSWLILPFCWLFMSIMFPFIFAMSIRNLGMKTKVGASFHIIAVGAGGALAPPLMGVMADKIGMAICFTIPLVGFLATTIYGLAYPYLLEKSANWSETAN
jgi:MFS transporter, FHS family, L-fucose permease